MREGLYAEIFFIKEVIKVNEGRNDLVNGKNGMWVLMSVSVLDEYRVFSM